MKKRASGAGRKQEKTPVGMSVAMQQLMLPLLLAMYATKKGLLSFVQQMGMVALSELLATEAAMIAARRASTSRGARIIIGARARRRCASAVATCRCRTPGFGLAVRDAAPR